MKPELETLKLWCDIALSIPESEMREASEDPEARLHVAGGWHSRFHHRTICGQKNLRSSQTIPLTDSLQGGDWWRGNRKATPCPLVYRGTLNGGKMAETAGETAPIFK